MKDTTKLTGLFRLRVSFAASSSIQGVAESAHGVSASLRANAVATLNTAGPVASINVKLLVHGFLAAYRTSV